MLKQANLVSPVTVKVQNSIFWGTRGPTGLIMDTKH